MPYVVIPPAPPPERRCAGLREGVALFERFHQFAPPSVVRVRCRRLMPRVLVHVGELRGLIYRSDRGCRARPRTYVHFLESPARLACDADGRRLYIVGGKYRVTRRGIEG